METSLRLKVASEKPPVKKMYYLQAYPSTLTHAHIYNTYTHLQIQLVLHTLH